MQIIVVAPASTEVEFRQKFTEAHQYLFLTDYTEVPEILPVTHVVFDFLVAAQPGKLELYRKQPDLIVFCHAVTLSLAQLIHSTHVDIAATLFGFNGWPTLLNRPCLEVTLLKEQDKPTLQAICAQLGTEYLVVDDRVGMVTPRVLAMVINEAYYTLQEKTATAADIDLAMKLGANYPYGPFEWAARIGLENIYQLLQAVYADTQDERYKICPLLKKTYLRETTQF